MSTIAAWVTFICGLIPVLSKIFLEKKAFKGEKILYILLGCFMIGGLVVGIKKINEDEVASKETKTELTKANAKLAEIDKKAGKIDTNVSRLAEIKEACENLHPDNISDSDIKHKQNMSQACDEFTEIYKNFSLTEDTTNKKITVYWYIKRNDNLKIKKYLKLMGLNIVSSNNSKNNVSSSNSIWYGSAVNPLQVRATAYTVIASGGKLKMIRRFYNSPQKARTIELAGDNSCKDNNIPPLEVELIKKLPNFPHKKSENETCLESLKNMLTK
jgi:hypothetical protein